MKFVASIAIGEELESWHQTQIERPLQLAVAQFVADMFSRIGRATPAVTGDTRKRVRVHRGGKPSSLSDVQSAPADQVIDVLLEAPHAERFEAGWPSGGGTSYSKVRTGKVIGTTKRGYYKVIRTTTQGRSLQAPDGIVSPLEPLLKKILTAHMRRNGL